MSEYKTKFINHSCVSFENKNHLMLVDPWFFSRVFNNSWSLLQNVNTDDINLNKLTHIFYTHEHPDHLNWPTLKFISENTKNKVWIVGLSRSNKNIKKQVEKMGFGYGEIDPNVEVKINENFSICQFPTGMDSAQVFKVNNKIILNQNDCKLSAQQVLNIKNKFSKIDLWLMQFGLAGYYANRDDKEGLNKARNEHLDMIDYYYKQFNPSYYVPFSSFIYFCKKYNCFLNDWQITIDDIYKKFKHLPLQIPFFNDELLFEDTSRRNQVNIDQWKKVFSEQKNILESTLSVTEKDIVSMATQFGDKYTANSHTPTEFCLELFDNENYFYCDMQNKIFSFVNKQDLYKQKLIASTSMEELYCFFRDPWGADTLNITSCFDIINKSSWKHLLLWKDSFYQR